jgi:2-C-methyl-D-erythritol 2,4-cyclodiphosphate synthase/2-C-methyl-D-erythritol 4-phosphate cytidylyltransferase
LRPFLACGRIQHAVLVVPDVPEARRILDPHLGGEAPVAIVPGGATRQESTARGVAATEAGLLLVHDGVRPFVPESLILRVLSAAERSGAAVPVLPVHETVKRVDPRGRIRGTLDRGEIGLSQTPQGFRREILEEALARARAEGYVGTDEAELVERTGHEVTWVPGEPANRKLTTPGDFQAAERWIQGAGGSVVRIGFGYDIHPLVPGRPLVLGGVAIPHPSGCAGHSDADLLAHAITDALLGAAGLPDIGASFPDTDPRFADARSLDLLAQAYRRVRENGFVLVNLDAVVITESPRIAPHLPEIRKGIAAALGCDPSRIGVKGKRGEGLGPVGRGEGIESHAVALLARMEEEGAS